MLHLACTYKAVVISVCTVEEFLEQQENVMSPYKMELPKSSLSSPKFGLMLKSQNHS